MKDKLVVVTDAISGIGVVFVSGNVTSSYMGSLSGPLSFYSSGAIVDLSALSYVNMSGGWLTLSGGSLTAPPGAIFGRIAVSGPTSISTSAGSIDMSAPLVMVRGYLIHRKLSPGTERYFDQVFLFHEEGCKSYSLHRKRNIHKSFGVSFPVFKLP